MLLSSAASALLGDDERAAVRRLGSYRLKDFPAPEPISQLVIDGLPRQFPRLRTGTARERRKRLLLAVAGVLVLAVASAGTWAAIAGDSGLSIGPTSLGVIDPTKKKLVDEIELGFKSSLIAAGEGYIWVADPQGSTLVKIDPQTRQIVGRVGVEAGAIPVGLAVGHGSVWLAVLRGTRRFVLELGPQFGEPRLEIAVGGPLEVGDDSIWVIDAATGGLSRIDPRSGRASELAEEGLSASSIAITPQAVWVAGLSTVTKVDPMTGLEFGEIPIGSPPGEVGSIAAGYGAVWFTSSAAETLWQIDPQSDAVTGTFPVGKGPSAVTAGEGAVWVANSRDGSVTRIDLQGNVETIRTGSVPAGVVAAYGQVWVTSGDPRA